MNIIPPLVGEVRWGPVISHNEDTASGMFRFGATVEAYTLPHRLIACLRHILHQRQEAFELGGYGDGYMVAERRDLVAHALERIAEPATVDNKATSDGIASGFVANKFNVHKNNLQLDDLQFTIYLPFVYLTIYL